MTESKKTERKNIDVQNRYNPLKRSQANLVQSHAFVIADLPLCVFHMSKAVRDSDDISVSEPYVEKPVDLVRLDDCGLVEKVGWSRVNGSLFHFWSAYDVAVKRAREYVEQLETPVPGCPHTGIRNVPGGGFTCCTDDCDNEVRREVVEYGE